jgi:adenylate cyclase class IV
VIEVEKKVALDAGSRACLLSGATRRGRVTFRDTYYDSSQYDLTKRDRWLRDRNGGYELKVAHHRRATPGGRLYDHFEELTEHAAIRETLGLTGTVPLRAALLEAGFSPFCVIATLRERYAVGEFTIDIDATDFGYEVAEVELVLDDLTERTAAQSRIARFLEERGVPIQPVEGKVSAYLREFSKEHYSALVEAGVLATQDEEAPGV